MSAPFPVHPAPGRHAVSPGALWFGLFGAPAAWSVQLMANYALTAHGCFPGSEPRATPYFGGLSTLVLVISAAALAVAAAAGGAAWRSWRTTRAEHPGGHEHLLETGAGRTRFMALAGLLLSGLFLLGVVMAAIPLFLVPPCGRA
jgi:hypothetical protein